MITGSRAGRAAAGALLAIAATLAVASSAVAATAGAWAAWTPLVGTSGAWTSSPSLAVAGLGPVTVSSTSAGGAVGVVTGATRWLGPSSPPGTVFGTSQDRPYLNLANATGGLASVTTYAFAAPAPGGTWALVLGDIDLETLTVSATGPGAVALSAAELGWAGAFNYCGGTGGPSCTGTAVPSVTTGATTVTLTGLGTNTDGAAGWFRPTAPVTTLTVTAQRLTGSTQVHQVWLVASSRDLSGTVTGPGGSGVAGTSLTFSGPDGTALGSTTTSAAGVYQLSGLPAVLGTLTVGPPSGLLVDGLATREVDLTGADAAVDLVLRAPVPVTASGAVVDTEGVPVAGAVVDLTDLTTTLTTTSASDGTWTSPALVPGTWTVTVTAPTGWVVVSAPSAVPVVVGQEGPVFVSDTTLRHLVPVTASGTVVDTSGVPVPGAVVTLTDGTTTLSTTSTADGTWTSPALAPGTWTVTVTAPTGWTVLGVAVTLTVGLSDEGATAPVSTVVRRSPAPADPPPTAHRGTDSGLAATGVDPRNTLTLAAVLLVAGSALTAAARAATAGTTDPRGRRRRGCKVEA